MYLTANYISSCVQEMVTNHRKCDLASLVYTVEEFCKYAQWDACDHTQPSDSSGNFGLEAQWAVLCSSANVCRAWPKRGNPAWSIPCGADSEFLGTRQSLQHQRRTWRCRCWEQSALNILHSSLRRVAASELKPRGTGLHCVQADFLFRSLSLSFCFIIAPVLKAKTHYIMSRLYWVANLFRYNGIVFEIFLVASKTYSEVK